MQLQRDEAGGEGAERDAAVELDVEWRRIHDGIEHVIGLVTIVRVCIRHVYRKGSSHGLFSVLP